MNTKIDWRKFLKTRGIAAGFLLLFGMLAFEASNFLSSQLGLLDILGNIKVAGFRWGSLLAFAFCAIDLAGIARIFTPEEGANEPAEVWYLFTAWLIAASFDAGLTWWSVKLAMLSNPSPSIVMAALPAGAANVIPVAVAAIELLLRILMINIFSTHAEKILGALRVPNTPYRQSTPYRPAAVSGQSAFRNMPQSLPRSPNGKPVQMPVRRPEPVYHPINMNQSKLFKEE